MYKRQFDYTEKRILLYSYRYRINSLSASNPVELCICCIGKDFWFEVKEVGNDVKLFDTFIQAARYFLGLSDYFAESNKPEFISRHCEE